jgi:tetratricopeptide (TPR) repeat protein
MSDAAELLSAASEFDPDLAAVHKPLANALRAVASAQFAAGEVQEALATFDRLLALGSPGPADEALIHSVELWLRNAFSQQMRDLKVGGAVFLLKQLARLAPKLLVSDVDLIEAVGELARLLAKHADDQPLEVLDAVIALQPLVPSSQLAFAGAAAYKMAITEAHRLHTAGETLKAVEFCEPSMRYRPRGPDRQLSHALATLLCRKVTDLLDSGDRGEALALHERTLAFLEACRSPGIVTT